LPLGALRVRVVCLWVNPALVQHDDSDRFALYFRQIFTGRLRYGVLIWLKFRLGDAQRWRFIQNSRFSVNIEDIWNRYFGDEALHIRHIFSGGYKIRDFQPIFRFISAVVLGRATIRPILWKASNSMWSIEWCHFQWPWMTSNLAIFFNVK